MTSWKSIRVQLMSNIAVFLVLMLGLSASAVLALSRVDASAEVINEKWLAGNRLLGELEREVFQFRLAESDRALAAAAQGEAGEEKDAALHRGAVEQAVASYIKVVGAEQPQANVSAFVSAWNDYLIIHDAWVRADVYRHANGVARSRSSLDWRYRNAVKSLDALKAANYRAADAQALESRNTARSAETIFVAASIAALVLAAGLSLQIRRKITKPLASITAALTRLAGGHLDTSIPEIDRADEIGAMAKAFEIFRANAAELQEAHEKTRQAQEQADQLARHDALTGLPNRRVFASELQSALGRALAGAASYAVMLIDLDRFKPVNDVQGHAAGDQVLCEVAQRLEAIPCRRKTVARLGGDEFAVIVEADADLASIKNEAATAAHLILKSLRDPFHIQDAVIEIGASIGIACCPGDGQDVEAILRASDLAMYRAKQGGRNTFRFFEQAMDQEIREQAILAECLREAIRTGGILPHYQPLIGLNADKIEGFEVLARWHHPVHGAIVPDRFIPMAERLGLIPDLTSAILRQACRDARHWGANIRLAVNVSPSLLTDHHFPLKVLAILSEEGFDPARLEIEITESALVGDIDTAKEILTAFQAVGISVALDDFGTGYSSLYHLRNLKFDKLKIDRSFVQSLSSNAESVKIVDAVLSLARSLGMPVVAEGIEDRAALQHLIQRGCEFGQGFYFSKAVPAHVAEAFINNRALRLSA